MSKLFSSQQIMSLVFVGLISGYGISQEQPSPTKTDRQNNNSPSPINVTLAEENVEYLPSPFAIAPNLTALPSSASGSEHSNEEFRGKKISLETRFLSVDEETHARIMKMIGSENLTMSGGPLVSESTPDQLSFDEQSERVVARESTLKGQPTVVGSISKEKFSRIVSEIKRQPNCSITQSPSSLVFEEQLCTIVDGAARPFVVSVKPKVKENSVLQVPVIQSIEEGTILRQKAKITKDGIRIATHLIFNQITDVDTFTISGSITEGVTIQVPTCKCQLVDCQFEVAKDTIVIVDPNFVEVHSVRKQKKGAAGRWLSRPKIAATKTRRLFAFTASVAE